MLAESVAIEQHQDLLYGQTYIPVFPGRPPVGYEGGSPEWIGDAYTWEFRESFDPFDDICDEAAFDDDAMRQLEDDESSEMLEHEPIEVAYLVGRARGFAAAFRQGEERSKEAYERGFTAGKSARAAARFPSTGRVTVMVLVGIGLLMLGWTLRALS